MRIFEKCPVCGDYAFVQPEYSNMHQRIFRCDKGHVFRRTKHSDIPGLHSNIPKTFPDWTEVLNECRKTITHVQ